MLRNLKGILPLAVIYCLIAFAVPKPASVKQESWQIMALFGATIAGLILQPIPGGALVLIAIVLSSVVGGLSIQSALSGYSEPATWLVLSAYFISRSLLNTGLARRIALVFVRLFGRTPVGVTYALAASDLTLAAIVPSNSARSGGVTLPIARAIAELYGSHPGETAGKLGSFLMVAVYQSICITAAMFLTGQSSNPAAAQLATESGFPITWLSWLVAGSVPGIISLLVVPLVVLKLYPPQLRNTPEVTEYARNELDKMGPMSPNEKLLLGVFLTICALWVTPNLHGINGTVVALLGCGALLLTGVLTWEDVKSEKSGWDVFIWFGGLVRLGKALNDGGVTKAFADGVSAWFGDATWPVLFAGALLIYFYSHYFFASISAHLLAMYPPFLAVLLLKGAPIGLVAFAFACFVNFSAGLTHFGTIPAPMYFDQNYVKLGDWWRIGFVVSIVNILIWSTAGFGWWKLLGIW